MAPFLLPSPFPLPSAGWGCSRCLQHEAVRCDGGQQRDDSLSRCYSKRQQSLRKDGCVISKILEAGSSFVFATPPLIEQHLLVHAWGPVPSTEDSCGSFVNKCADVFLQKERKRSCEKGPLLHKKGLITRRRRALRSNRGKKRKAYEHRKTKCAGEASAGWHGFGVSC